MMRAKERCLQCRKYTKSKRGGEKEHGGDVKHSQISSELKLSAKLVTKL